MLWALARRQHGVLLHAQLVEYGLTHDAIRHRVSKGRLHPIHRGVYSVGRAELTRHGRWMAAVLSCGPGAVLSHQSAAALFGVVAHETKITLCVPRSAHPRRRDIRVHRVALPPTDTTLHEGVPCTTPTRTLIDLAAVLSESRLERAINDADKLGLLTAERLRSELEGRSHLRGLPSLRRILDRDTFPLTDSELERRFLRLVASAGLPLPETGAHLNGYRVDFYWPELGLVVETDGLRYHRTAAQQARDRRRDQAHAAAGLTMLRFTHAQITHEPESVVRTLRAVAGRARALGSAPPNG